MLFISKEFLKGRSSQLIAGFFLTLLGLVGTLFLWHAKAELLPTFWTSCVALFFAYLAYLHSREKFRLDLLEERVKAYESLKAFTDSLSPLSIVYNNSLGWKFPDKEITEFFEKAVSKASAFGNEINVVKLKRLFGNDISEYYDQLIELYQPIYINGYLHNFESLDIDYIKVEYDLKKLVEHASLIEGVFLPYLYFGHYRL